MSGIEQYFDDKHWDEFSEFCPEPTDSEPFHLLTQKIDDRELARVIWLRREEHFLNWIDSSIPALEGLTPMDCLSSLGLTNRLKVCLLRMQ